MVSVEYKYGRFSALFNLTHQISCKFIHLMHHIDIVFPCVFLALILRTGYYDLRIFNHFLRRILSVSLNTDCKDKILPFCGIHRLVKVF